MKGNGLVNRLVGFQPVFKPRPVVKPRPEAPLCFVHKGVHMKYIGHLYHSGYRRNVPHWLCPVRGCGYSVCRPE